MDTDEFIRKAIEKHGDKYIYSKVTYVNAKTHVIIICKLHGEFKQIPYSHYGNGFGCRKCGRMKLSENMRHSTQDFIRKATEKHGDKFDYSVSDYKGVDSRIKIICKLHGEFSPIAGNHLTGDGGCIECRKIKCRSIFSMSTGEFISRAKEIHGDDFDYSKVRYVNYQTKVVIICKIHGEFEQTPGEHLAGCKCGKCKGIRISLAQRYTREQFIEKAIAKHGNVYDYSLVDYVDSQTPVKIICNIHGVFEQTPNSHTGGSKCCYCSSHRVHELNSLASKFPDIAKEWHPTKNLDKSPNDFMPFSEKHVWWKCSKNPTHVWKGSIGNRTNRGRGCSKCASTFSKISLEWLRYIEVKYSVKIQTALSENGEYKIPSTQYKADGYCLENNTIYEFHGSIWHGDPRHVNYDPDKLIHGVSLQDRYNNTQIKKQKIINLNYNYVEMWEYDWKKFINTVKKVQQIYRYYHSD